MTPENLASAIRTACIAAAADAYEDAGLRGLCREGRWEAALSALQALDLERLLAELQGHNPPAPGARAEPDAGNGRHDPESR